MTEMAQAQVTIETTAVSLATPQTQVAEPACPLRLHRTQLRSFLERQRGKFVSVDFVKKDGTARGLNGRLGVRNHLQGGSDSLADRRHLTPYLCVFDAKEMGYRNVNLATVSQVRASGQSYLIEG